MEIELIMKNISLTDQQLKIIRDKFESKLSQLISDFDSDTKRATMTVAKRSGWGYEVKYTMNLPQKKYIHAQAVNDSFETAIIDLREKIERQIKKYKEEIRS